MDTLFVIKKPERHSQKKRKESSTNGIVQTGYLQIEEYKLIDQYLLSSRNSSIIGSKLQHKARQTEPYGREVGDHLELISIGEDFLNRTPMLQALKSTNNGWDLLSFCKAKDTDKDKQQATELETIFTNSITNRGPISKIHMEFKKSDINKTIQFKMRYKSKQKILNGGISNG